MAKRSIPPHDDAKKGVLTGAPPYEADAPELSDAAIEQIRRMVPQDDYKPTRSLLGDIKTQSAASTQPSRALKKAAMKTEPRCDVAVVLGDVTFEMYRHKTRESFPDRQELNRWQNSLAEAGRAFQNLQLACEDIVELGVSDERVAAMKQALTLSQGQAAYRARGDRW